MWGITVKVARDYGYQGEMKKLPLSLAKLIYKEQYWDVIKADALPEDVRLPMFDAAVNSGTTQAARWLQASVGVQTDGVIGRVTLEACKRVEPVLIASRLLGYRLEFMASLPTWPSFGRGWARRIASLLKNE